MKSAVTAAAWMGLAFSLGCAPLLAQQRDNSEKQLACNNRGDDGDRARYCEMREQSAAAVGRLAVDPGRNGGVTVKGWLRNDVLVRTRVESAADTQAAASAMAKQVSVDVSAGQVRASGPSNGDNSWWSISYEIFAPQSTDLTVKTYNGGLNISDLRGQIRFDAHNGGVKLARLAGDVSGETVNGGIQVELAGATWNGRQLEVRTQNGGVTVAMPAAYSARVQAETTNGSIQSDFPFTVQGNVRPKQLDTNIGSGGPLIHVTTHNGGVKLRRTEAQ